MSFDLRTVFEHLGSLVWWWAGMLVSAAGAAVTARYLRWTTPWSWWLAVGFVLDILASGIVLAAGMMGAGPAGLISGPAVVVSLVARMGIVVGVAGILKELAGPRQR